MLTEPPAKGLNTAGWVCGFKEGPFPGTLGIPLGLPCSTGRMPLQRLVPRGFPGESEILRLSLELVEQSSDTRYAEGRDLQILHSIPKREMRDPASISRPFMLSCFTPR